MDVPRTRPRCGRGPRAPLGHARGIAPAPAPAPSSSGPLLFAAQLLRADRTQPRAPGRAEPPAEPRALCRVRASPSPHGSLCGSGGRLRLRPAGNSLIKAGAGQRRDPGSKHLPVRAAPDPPFATPRKATPGAAAAGQDTTGGDPAAAGRPRRCPAVLSRRARLREGTRTSPPRTSEEAGSLWEGEAGICCVT